MGYSIQRLGMGVQYSPGGFTSEYHTWDTASSGWAWGYNIPQGGSLVNIIRGIQHPAVGHGGTIFPKGPYSPVNIIRGIQGALQHRDFHKAVQIPLISGTLWAGHCTKHTGQDPPSSSLPFLWSGNETTTPLLLPIYLGTYIDITHVIVLRASLSP